MRKARAIGRSLRLVGALLLAAATSAGQGPPVSVVKLFAPDGEAYDHFGFGAAVDGEWLVLGADGDDDDGAAALEAPAEAEPAAEPEPATEPEEAPVG